MKRNRLSRILCVLLALFLLPIIPLGLFSVSSAAKTDQTKVLYLSDIPWVSWRMYKSASDNPNSPYAPSKDQNEAGDPLTIAGILYEKGLRTHPDEGGRPAEFVYDISAYDYTTFSATVGKDSRGGDGNIQFMVEADGVIVAESPILPFGEDYDLICDITGCKTLKLITADGGDSCISDSAAWGNAMLSYKKVENIKENEEMFVPENDNLSPMDRYATYLAMPETFPVSFDYEGVTYRGFSKEHFETVSRTEGSIRGGTTTTLTWLHRASGLTVTIVATVYPAYNAYEWTVYFTNNTSENSGTLSHINGAEVAFYGDAPKVKGIGGDYQSRYTKYERPLTSPMTVNATSGRPTHDAFPYYNLEYGTGGTFIAVGWPGTFFASFTPVEKDNTTATVFRGGQMGLSTYLVPGETIRTPLMAFVHYDEQGDAAVNVWRDFMIDCNIPKDTKGDPVAPLLSASTSWIYGCMTNATEETQLEAIRNYLAYDIPLDAWWMDAGWYLGAEDATIERLDQSGNWKVDLSRFPTAFRAVSELAQENGMKTILWFEPELFRLSVDEILETNPGFERDWVVGPLSNNGKLVDLGNEETRKWVYDTITGIMDAGDITVYRQDFNESPGNAWRSRDTDGRSGMTENAYCQGYLAYWDAMIERYPDGFIDNCASGGGRLDLESMRRSVALHRTDASPNDNDFGQAQDLSESLSEWLVYSGTPTNGLANDTIDVYAMRSVFAPAMTLNFNITSKSPNWPLLSALTHEWEVIKDYYYADYYCLIPGGRSNNAWRAWEYYDEAKGEGFLQVFRPEYAKGDAVTLTLKGLDPHKTYVLTDFNHVNSIKATGKALMEGYTVSLPEARSAATIFIGAAAIDVPDYASLVVEKESHVATSPDVPQGSIFVSDLPMQSWVMFGGTSEDAAPPYRPSIDSGEHGPLSIGGVIYEKGLRAHISEKTNTCELVYDLSGLDVNRFRAIVGKDAAGTSGDIRFQLYVDGEKVAETPIMSAGDTYLLEADITGGRILKLHATDGEDGYAYDSVGWGNAIVYKEGGEDTAPSVPTEDETTVDTDVATPPTEGTDVAEGDADATSDGAPGAIAAVTVTLLAAGAVCIGTKKNS